MVSPSALPSQPSPQLILASASPRRRELLAQLAIPFVVMPANIDESAWPDEAPRAYTMRVAYAKVQHIAQQYGSMAEPVSQRIVRTLLRLHQQFGTTLPVTHRELAQMSWTTTESAIRAVRGLKRRGFVSGTRGRLMVKQAAALEQVLAHVNG